jgi:hypothetical protein
MMDPLEEPGALGWIVAEPVTEHPERTRGVAKVAGDGVGRTALHEEVTQGFVLPVERGIGSEKEASGGGGR